jgi:hypothetical protein
MNDISAVLFSSACAESMWLLTMISRQEKPRETPYLFQSFFSALKTDFRTGAFCRLCPEKQIFQTSPAFRAVVIAPEFPVPLPRLAPQ